MIYLFNTDHHDSIKEKESGNDICLNKISGNRKITILKNKHQHFYYFILKIQALIQLTHFQPMFHFYTSRKHQKTGGFLTVSDVFRGYTSGKQVENGLMSTSEAQPILIELALEPLRKNRSSV